MHEKSPGDYLQNKEQRNHSTIITNNLFHSTRHRRSQLGSEGGGTSQLASLGL